MKERLNIYYDEEGDFFELQIGKPTPSYYEESSNGVFERIDEKTGKIRGVAIFNFKKRTEKLKELSISLPTKIELSNSR